MRALSIARRWLNSSRASRSLGSNTSQLTPVELARHLLDVRKGGQLSSVRLAQELEFDQAPLFSSLVAYVRRPNGDLVLGLPSISQHVGNYAKYSQMGSMLVVPITPDHINPVEFPVLPKLNLSGAVEPIPDSEKLAAITELRSRHRILDHVIDRLSPHLFRVETGVLTPGEESEGKTHEFEVKELNEAPVDPLGIHQLHIIEQLGLTKHQEKLRRAIAFYAELPQPVSDAFVFNVDRFGFDAVGEIGEYWRRFRLPFPVPLIDPTFALKAVLEGLDEAAQAAEIEALRQKEA